MSTRSRIGKRNADGTITGIYCHFDGYPEHHAPILTENYATSDRADALIALGDLSSLGPQIGEKQGFNRRTNDDWCLAYSRDRGDSGCEPKTYATETQFCNEHWYNYLFQNEAWYMSVGHGPFVLLPVKSTSAPTITSIRAVLVREFDDFKLDDSGDIYHKIVPREFARVVGGYVIAALSDKTHRAIYLDIKCMDAAASVSPSFRQFPEEVYRRIVFNYALITLAKEGIFRA